MAARVETWLVDQAVIRGIAAFAAGYVVGALPVAWLLARRRPGIRSAVLAVVLEVLKGAAVGLAARLYTDSGWFIATAIAGCVAGDAFPVGFRRGGRGLVPLVSGLVVALPTAGVITAITAVPTALFTSMRGSIYDAVVLVAVPVGLLLGTREWQSLGPAAGRTVGSRLARRFGRPLLLGPGRRVGISASHLDLADRWFARFGLPAVFFGRMLPVVCTYISFPAGLARVPPVRFVLLSLAGAIPWCTGLAFLGYAIGSNYDRVAGPIGKAAIVIAVLIVLGLLAWFIRGRRRSEPSISR